ncbi:hypothetical protein RHMOL_Rhmol12G0053500 [Rhododendron molle]|uniref:Uncharacterized protein n=1 Tax=Rhododendron molle TaxID=49168 RepID=A0ACC0LFV6_RHOML|nr:hypothetical protein RHMOL_Rhmol12G0053500 [Rhododendron molle]
MGNCQTVDAAALVIQHPNGQTERKYWTVSASEVMKLNPGHYVSLIIPLPEASNEEKTTEQTVKFTRVKLLRPSDTLVLGRAYRLVTSQDPEKQSSNAEAGGGKSELEKTSQAMRHERHRQRNGSTNSAAARARSWRPSLNSISESGS